MDLRPSSNSLLLQDSPLRVAPPLPPPLDAWEQSKAALLDQIKRCGKQKDLFRARKLHSDLVSRQTSLARGDPHVSSALIRMYSRCRSIREAEDVFGSAPARTVVLWNALISGYVELQLFEEALSCFARMQNEGFTPDPVTFSCALNACGRTRCVEAGEEIDGEVRRRGLLEKDVILGNALVDMYARCGMQGKARRVFDSLPNRNVVTWNALIGGYARHGLGEEALQCFSQMRLEGMCPDPITFACALKACGCARSLAAGEEIHGELRRRGLLARGDLVLGTALMDMYAKCGVMEKAEEVFVELPRRDVVAWNALMDGYAQLWRFEEVLDLFAKMQEEGGAHPDDVTAACVLRACGHTGSLGIGYAMHGKLREERSLQNEASLGTALLDMYVRCGEVAKAREVLEEIRARDVVAWSAMIHGYAQHGLGREAMQCFIRMREEGIAPNAITYTCILRVCGEEGLLEMGEAIHAAVRSKEGLVPEETSLGNALVDMYVKCGALDEAQQVFGELRVRDVVAWNSLLTAYAHLGHAKSVFRLFIGMLEEEEEEEGEAAVRPDQLTFLTLLTACSHGGLVEEGQILFGAMCTSYHLSPALEHHTCVVDLCARAGRFDKALLAVEHVAASERLPPLLSLLSSCRKWGNNVELARWAFEQASIVDEECVALHVGMGNIYAA